MKQWWLSLQARERRTLILGGAVLTIMFIYFVIWQPFKDGLVKLEKQVAEQQAVKVWMEKSAAEVKQLKGSGQAMRRPVGGGQSLLALVDQTLKRGNLASALKRLEPEGGTAVRVWLEQASFDDMMRWLLQLEQQSGVVPTTITVDRQPDDGRVNARVTLEGGH